MAPMTLTAGMRGGLPPTRETRRIGPGMRVVLRVLYETGGEVRGASLREFCRQVARARGCGWTAVSESVRALRQMGLVEGPSCRLTPVGQAYCRKRFGGGTAAPAPRVAEIPVSRSSAPAVPRPVSRPSAPAASPDLQTFDRRCASCGFDTCVSVPGRRAVRCQRCGAARMVGG